MTWISTAPLTVYRHARNFARRLRRRAVFEQIYRDNLWGDAESRSGTGSGLAATENIRAGLLEIIQELGVRTVVDAPCGDFFWLSKLDLAQHLKWYRGLDIVPPVIARNKDLYASPKISFERADLTKRVPPAADLILCRHLLIHLPMPDCRSVLRNFKNSGSRYLMITNQPHIPRNEEILFTGSFRPINLGLPPFNFPPPLRSVDDAQAEDDHSVAAVFDLSKLTI